MRIIIKSTNGTAEEIDCASIVTNMYCGFFDRNGVKFTRQSFAVATLRGVATLESEDVRAYKLSNEHGLHRFIRISPFDSGQRRHTSLVQVDVTDEFGDPQETDLGLNPIRSYVFHPYKMVKDRRTGVSTTELESVLAGDIERFMVPFQTVQ